MELVLLVYFYLNPFWAYEQGPQIWSFGTVYECENRLKNIKKDPKIGLAVCKTVDLREEKPSE